MRSSLPLVAALFFLAAVPLHAGDAEDKRADELRSMEERIRRLEQKVNEATAKSDSAADTQGSAAIDPDVPPPLPSELSKALDNVTLPPQPTEAQCRAALGKILSICLQAPDSDPGPAAARLFDAVGDACLPALLDALQKELDETEGDETPLTKSLFAAALRSMTPTHRDAVLAALPSHTIVARLLARAGWYEESREAVLGVLQGHPQHLPDDLLDLASLINDKRYDPLLASYLADAAPTPATAYDYISMKPGITLDDAVRTAWTRLKDKKPDEFEKLEFAGIAAGHGVNAALRFLADALDPANTATFREDRVWLRRTILLYTDRSGSDADLVAWVRANGERLTWDSARRLFVEPTTKP